VSSSIAAAMEQQAAATQEIARNVAGSSTAVGQASSRAAEVQEAAQGAGQLAESVRAGTGEVEKQVSAMRNSLVEVVRTSMKEADRRAEPRFPVHQACTVEAGGARQEAILLDISAHGCLVNGAPIQHAGARMRVAVPSWGVATRLTSGAKDPRRRAA
jgi:aerotaxis receptor